MYGIDFIFSVFKELFIIFIEYVFLLKELLDKDFLFFNVSLELLVSFLRCVENFYIYNKSDVRLFVLLNFDLYGDWMINIRLEYLYIML